MTTRRHRVLIIVAGIVVLFLAAIGIGLEALKSDAVKSRIASALSTALGQPVEIGALSVSLLPKPNLDARDIRVGGAGPDAAPGITLGSLSVAPAILSLLPGWTPTIEDVELDSLVFSMRRGADGHWMLPVASVGGPSGSQATAPKSAAPPAATAGSHPVSINLNQLRVRHGALRVVDDSLRSGDGGSTVTTISDIAGDVQDIGGAITVSHFTGRVGHTVVDGSANLGPSGAGFEISSSSISNADLPGLFALAGMRPYSGFTIGGKCTFEMSASIGSELAKSGVKGKIAFGNVQIGTIAMQEFDAPFQLDKGVVTLDPISFTLYQGHMQGTISVDLKPAAPVYHIKANLTGLDVDQILSATTTMKDVLAGTGQLSTDVHGSGTSGAAIQQSLAGSLTFDLENGDLRHMPLVAEVNRVLRVTGGSGGDTKFESLKGNATIGGGKAQTNDLTLHAGKLTILAQGTYAFDQTLNFKTTTTISGAKAQNVANVAGQTQNGQAAGGLQLPGHITGTASNPKVTFDVGSLAKQEEKNVRKNAVNGIKGLFKH